VSSSDPTRFEMDGMSVDLDAHEAGSVLLTEQEVALLRVLWEGRGRPVDKATLYREVWGYRSMPRGRALDFAVRRLRKKLGPPGESALETVRGVGFRLRAVALPVSPSTEVPPPPAPLPTDGGRAALRRLRPPTPYVGSTAVMAELAERLDQRQRCITLLGPAGIGKTRLAVEVLWARRQPVRVVELADLPRGADPIRRLAAVLTLSPTTQSIDTLAAAAARAGPGVLLVDRCAHVADQLRAPLEAILRQSDLIVLTTSRHRLGLAGEVVFDVGPLDTPTAARLLVDRARAVRRGLRLTPEDAVAKGIVHHLGGVPLAIELAASRLRATRPAQLERRLAEDLSAIHLSGPRPLADAISWSWDLLSDDLRAALVRLTALDGSFDDVGAAAVLGEEPDAVWTAIEGLLDRSWLQPVDDEHGLQYAILAPLRAWVRQRVGPPPPEALDGLIHLCIRRARAGGPLHHSCALGLDALRLVSQHAVDSAHPLAGLVAGYSVRAASRALMPAALEARAVGLQDRLRSPSVDLTVEVGWAVQRGGDDAHARALLDQTDGCDHATVLGRLRGRWLDARLLTNAGQTALAAERCERLCDDALQAGIAMVAAGAASLLVELYIDLGRTDDALQSGRRAQSIATGAHGHGCASHLAPNMLIRLAPLYLMKGEVDLARTMLRDAAVAGRRAQSPVLEGGAWVNLAMLEAIVGCPEAARPLLERVERANFSMGRAMTDVQVLLGWAYVARAEGDLDRARQCGLRGIEVARAGGVLRMVAVSMGSLMWTDVVAGRHRSEVTEEALRICRDGGLQLMGCTVVGLAAWLAARAGDAHAGALATEALGLADAVGDADEVVYAYAGAAVGRAAVGDRAGADRCLEAGARLSEKLAHLRSLADVVPMARREVAERLTAYGTAHAGDTVAPESETDGASSQM